MRNLHNPERYYLHNALLNLTTDDLEIVFKPFDADIGFEEHGDDIDEAQGRIEAYNGWLLNFHRDYKLFYARFRNPDFVRLRLQDSNIPDCISYRHDLKLNSCGIQTSKLPANLIREIRVLGRNEQSVIFRWNDSCPCRLPEYIFEENISRIEIDFRQKPKDDIVLGIISYNYLLDSDWQEFSFEPRHDHDGVFLHLYHKDSLHSDGMKQVLDKTGNLIFRLKHADGGYLSLPLVSPWYEELGFSQQHLMHRYPRSLTLHYKRWSVTERRLDALVRDSAEIRDFVNQNEHPLFCHSIYSPDYLMDFLSGEQLLVNYPEPKHPINVTAEELPMIIAPLDWYGRKGECLVVNPVQRIDPPVFTKVVVIERHNKSLVEIEYGSDQMWHNYLAESNQLNDKLRLSVHSPSKQHSVEILGVTREVEWSKLCFIIEPISAVQMKNLYHLYTSVLHIGGKSYLIDTITDEGKIIVEEQENSGAVAYPFSNQPLPNIGNATLAQISGLIPKLGSQLIDIIYPYNGASRIPLFYPVLDDQQASQTNPGEFEGDLSPQSSHAKFKAVADAGLGISATLKLTYQVRLGNVLKVEILPKNPLPEDVEICGGEFFYPNSPNDYLRIVIPEVGDEVPADLFDLEADLEVDGYLLPRLKSRMDNEFNNGHFFAAVSAVPLVPAAAPKWKVVQPFTVKQYRPPERPDLTGAALTSLADQNGRCDYHLLVRIKKPIPFGLQIERQFKKFSQENNAARKERIQIPANGSEIETVGFKVLFKETSDYIYCLYKDKDVRPARNSSLYYRVIELDENFAIPSKHLYSDVLICDSVRSLAELPTPRIRGTLQARIVSNQLMKIAGSIEQTDLTKISNLNLIASYSTSNSRRSEVCHVKGNDFEVELDPQVFKDAFFEEGEIILLELTFHWEKRPTKSWQEPIWLNSDLNWDADNPKFLSSIKPLNRIVCLQRSAYSHPKRVSLKSNFLTRLLQS